MMIIPSDLVEGLNSTTNKIIIGHVLDVLKKFPSDSVDLIIFSPPYYGLRYYSAEANVLWSDGWFGQLGSEPSPDMYIDHLFMVVGELKRVLKSTGSIYINIGDSYSRGGKGVPEKSLIGIPWRLALRCIDELGLILRNAIIWYKPNSIPSSAKDRLATTYEFIFHFVKSKKYYYNLDFIRVPPSSLDIDERRHYLVIRLHEWAKRLRSSGYNGKSRGLSGWDNVLGNLKAYRLALKILSKLERLSDDEVKFLKDYVQNHVSHPGGRNPGDLISIDEVKQRIGDAHKGEATANLYRPHKSYNELGKNPGDLIYTKHDIAVGRIGNFSYIDPIHTRGYHPLGKNPGDIFKINTRPFKEAHFAVYPVDLVLYPILSSCPPDGVVLDPFFGAGTTALAVEYINHGMWDKFKLYVNPLAKRQRWNLKWIGIEIVREYCEIARKRLESEIPRRITIPSIEVELGY